MTNVFEKYSDKFSGVWNLISWEMYDSDGPDKKLVSKPHGDDPLGKAVISPSGYLSAILVPRACMTPFLSDEWGHASDEEVLRVSRNLTAYAGPMTLLESENGDGSFLWHTAVEIANNPNWVGKLQTRKAVYSEENGIAYMTLEPVKWYYHKDGSKTRGVLKWQKGGS
ncbi:uncharacterized protein Z518_01552 [Rhinocladiella mackenziei CBS 650.93]|uniref:Rhinocladiella mackenziei CBS 650.93 unplaced genomic scaffold supercont1.1, whole genome shotgun sequence n=1 Tax=Rhinocladiella mackenziei CBS 650.93 TaxID=1442369 RepID=A0A0D2IWV2_9EURO|nr:uncharacterized protein Z518_01552 [Rhinocladiella mackenziei CBS 650.93]KIX10469.1 hypothetical protein Z518_01552 [Rhinocladiella mackenziei CBS 650.93]